ncbi:helix-turn-helix domain-containing protein [Nocardiopsis prasina]|uniref:helix-turn-helix domain-containing protein n=1 Tax=Nocardiopsis prasina TaxID=2015 RepID=UPI000475B1ED|nr:helix-turn-helix transcriptional regulator [Nocardiopsis prasina]
MSSSPTLRRKRLSRQLRALREDAGLTAEDVTTEAKARSGKTRGWSLSKLIRLEKADWKRLSFDDLKLLLEIYEVPEGEWDPYITLAKEGNRRGWWASFGDALGTGQFVGLESEATRIRTYQSMVIPGLLQTEEYARAMLLASGMTDDEDLDLRVQARMFRKGAVFHSSPAATLWAIIDESALRRIPKELHSQLAYLIEVSHTPNIGVQVLPLSRGLHGETGQMVILDFEPPDPSVVYLEVMAQELYLEKPTEITHYQHVYDHLQATALSVEESRDHIRGLMT